MAVARVVGLVLVAALGLGACGDDDDEGSEPVTDERWAQEAEELCAQSGPFLARAYTEDVPDSDAQEVAFYTTELIPRIRAMVNQLALLGFPPDKDTEYRTALNDVLDALTELEAEPYRYIDERHSGINPEEDLLVRVQQGLATANVPC